MYIKIVTKNFGKPTKPNITAHSEMNVIHNVEEKIQDSKTISYILSRLLGTFKHKVTLPMHKCSKT